jgi:type 2 lantibiotic biosynthesis protein LanM
MARATTLAERLALAASEGGQVDEATARVRMERWVESAGGGDPEALGKRWAWSGVSEARAWRALVAPPASERPGNLWAGTLSDIVEAAAEQARSGWTHRLPPPIDGDDVLPYEDVLLPAILVARRRVEGGDTPFATPAVRDLERALLRRLSELAAGAVHQEHMSRVPAGRRLARRFLPPGAGDGSRVHYDEMVESWLRDGLMPLFLRYPVLGRLLAVAVDQWVEATNEMAGRIYRDTPSLRGTFDPLGERTGDWTVTAVRAHLSDFHRGGRSVATLTFACGAELVYKPKCLALDDGFGRLLSWLAERGGAPALSHPRILTCGEYGYVEYVAWAPCADLEAANRFYERAGALLAVVYAVGGTDCHRENLIAGGEHPVLVDLETLLHPETLPWSDGSPSTDAARAVYDTLRNSILRTGLVPRWDFDGQGEAFDVSGFGRGDAVPGGGTESRWLRVNTDDMDLATVAAASPPDTSVPAVAGVPLAADDYVRPISLGFERMYRLLTASREALLEPGGPLDALRGLPVRFLFRPTRVYARLHERAVTPLALGDGAERSIQLEALVRGFVTGPERPAAWPMLQDEIDAMERLDVPVFTTTTDSDALPMGDGAVLRAHFEGSGHARTLAQFARFGEDDLLRQREILRLTFAARGARASAHAERHGHEEAPPVRAPASPEPSTDALVGGAVALAEEIGRRAVRGRDGSAAWLDVGYDQVSERFQFQPMGLGLYDGAGGVALFLAGLERVTGDPRFRPLALGALLQVRRLLRYPDRKAVDRVMKRLGIGGVTGLGSIIHVLVRVAGLLDDRTLLVDANLAADLLTADAIAADHSLDVMGGVAGALLALLALHEATGQGLDRARACGLRLLECRVPAGEASSAWATLGGRRLVGFSHGAAGISYALSRLWGVTGEGSFADGALEGFEYVRRSYAPEHRNWPDLRRDDGPRFSLGWCNGAAGIAMAFSEGAGLLGTPDLNVDALRAVTVLAEGGWSGVDHLCCGNAGQVEALLGSARRLGRPEWKAKGLEGAAILLERASSAPGPRLFSPTRTDVFSPGFFRGTAGIGYQLLRSVRPGLLPPALLLG